MDKKSYYIVLGVSRTETASGIRAAYRDLVKKLHPDVAGESAAPAFREVTEAYDVLSDPSRRHGYDDQLRRIEQRDREQPDSRTGRPRPGMHSAFAPFEVREGTSPSFEAMHERLMRNFTHLGVPKSERLEALNFEVVLTPGEAWRGCVVPIEIPAFLRCLQCAGSGWDWAHPCVHCGQRGLVEAQHVVHLNIPPGVESGTAYDLVLDTLGIRNFYLRVHVFVQRQGSIV
ncbi:MAG TPA: DnaJ domain-containing protein [Polyangiaceae bacterium]|nr:DnaJ domain-containing protein [Polyangiaceae bacterium]